MQFSMQRGRCLLHTVAKQFVPHRHTKGVLSLFLKKSVTPCRLLYVVGQLGLGGLERQLCYLLRDLDKARYRPELVVWNYSTNDIHVHEIKSLGIPIHSFPSGISRVEKLRALCRLTQQVDPEVIHSYSFFTNFAAYWCALGTDAIAVGSLRGDFCQAKKVSGPLIGRLSARWPRFHIFNSFASAEEARRSQGLFCPKHIEVVRNGLDMKYFCTFNKGTMGKKYIASIGSLLPLKRWDRVLRMVLEVKRRGANCLVKIAGDGPEREALEKQAYELGISDCIELIGATRDVPAFLEGASFLVHTSDTEGCPNAVMEALACSRPVIAMDAGDI